MPAFFMLGTCYRLSAINQALIINYSNTFSFRLTFAVRASSAT
jgi:hypothetical protein